MHVFVLALGILALVIGAVATGFGITIKEFSLGNTLLITGTTTSVGGMVMIGIGGAIRELGKIARALTGRPQPRYARPGEPLDPRAGIGMPRPPAQQMPPFSPLRAPPDRMQAPPAAVIPPPAAVTPGPQPDLAMRPAADAPSPPERPAPLATSLAPPVGEPILVEEPGAFPLSPRQPLRAVSAETAEVEPIEPRRLAANLDAGWEPSRHPRNGTAVQADPEKPGAAIDPPAPRAEWKGESESQAETEANAANAEHQRTPEPEIEHPQESERPASVRRHPFDAIWPEDRSARHVAAATAEPGPVEVPDAPSSAPAAFDADFVADRELPQPPEPETADERPSTVGAVEEGEPARAVDERPEPSAEVSRPVAILKSGVVDGMAYTLYADGSIEAVLAGETIRFTSIDDLRQHIEAGA
jgi:hypothetical protein